MTQFPKVKSAGLRGAKLEGARQITLDYNKKCAECGKGYAAQNGLCLSCTGKAMKGKKMKSAQGAIVAQRFYDLKQQLRGKRVTFVE